MTDITLTDDSIGSFSFSTGELPSETMLIEQANSVSIIFSDSTTRYFVQDAESDATAYVFAASDTEIQSGSTGVFSIFGSSITNSSSSGALRGDDPLVTIFEEPYDLVLQGGNVELEEPVGVNPIASGEIYLSMEAEGSGGFLAIEDLGKMANLHENWDGYGGIAPTMEAIATTQHLLQFAYGARNNGLGISEPELSPLSDGGIIVEWVKDDKELVVEVTADASRLVVLADFETDGRAVVLKSSPLLHPYITRMIPERS